MTRYVGQSMPVHECVRWVIETEEEQVEVVEMSWASAAALMWQTHLLTAGRDDEAVLWTSRGAVRIRPLPACLIPVATARFFGHRVGECIAEATLSL